MASMVISRVFRMVVSDKASMDQVKLVDNSLHRGPRAASQEISPEEEGRVPKPREVKSMRGRAMFMVRA